MTAHADRDFGVSVPVETLAVHGGVILGHLVHTKRGIVLPHEARIGVTVPANLGDLLARRFADESFGAVHRSHRRVLGVAAMAGNATKALEGMDILSKILHRLCQPVDANHLMTCNAALDLLLCRRSGDCHGNHQSKQQTDHARPRPVHFRPRPSARRNATRSAISSERSSGRSALSPSRCRSVMKEWFHNAEITVDGESRPLTRARSGAAL